MTIQFEQSGSKGAFFIQEGDGRIAQMTFSMAGNLMIIDHTEVSDALRGTGAGKLMVAAAVDHARKNSLKIMPLCPFAKSVFEKTTQYHDVLDA